MKKILAIVSLFAVAIACGSNTPDVNINGLDPGNKSNTTDAGPAPMPVVDAGQPNPEPAIDAGPTAPVVLGACVFVYTDWSTCINLKQTRQVESYSPTGCTGNSVLERTCVDPDSCAGAGQEPFNCGTYVKKSGATEICGGGACGNGFACSNDKGGICETFDSLCWPDPSFKSYGSCVHTLYSVDANCVRTIDYKVQVDYYGTATQSQDCSNNFVNTTTCNNQSVATEAWAYLPVPAKGNPTHVGAVGGVQEKYVYNPAAPYCYQTDTWYYPNKTRADAQADAKSQSLTYIDP